MKRPWHFWLCEYSILLTMAGVITALDQWTKWLVRTLLPPGSVWAPWEWLLPYARIVHWYNRGAAFGMLPGWGAVFTVLAILVSALILYYYPRLSPGKWAWRVAMWLQLGGAVGNLIDRLTLGQVTDFISVGSFPVFNIADSSITISVIVLLLGHEVEKRWSRRRMATGEQGDNG